MSDKSYEIDIPLDRALTNEDAKALVQRAAAATSLYISHIGKFSRVKYPDSVHWHFKRDKKEAGLIDATFFKGTPRLWLQLRNREPQWVHDTAPILKKNLEVELKKLG